MTCFNLSDRLLRADGILERLKEIQLSLVKIPEEKRGKAYSAKLLSIQKDLQSIFFEGLQIEDIRQLLSSPNSIFNPDYSRLGQALISVFSELPLPAMIGRIEQTSQEDWQPDSSDLEHHFNRLNGEHRYFDEEQMGLFRALVMSCREVCVLIEKNNTLDDRMAYDYAYKLMALLVDESKPLPTFKKLSEQVESLLKPKDKCIDSRVTYFHDSLLDFRLPSRAHDRSGWLSFIQENGTKALPFFSMAERIEKRLGRAPDTLKEAMEVRNLLTYRRALENEEWTELCARYQVPEETFNSGLDYIGSVWPKKEEDKIPSLTIEQGAYIWTKLSASDKRGLILGKIVVCCQSIGDDSSQCVEDAMSLDENALYVLLKRKGDSSNPYYHSDGTINDQDYQIIGQSYVWKSKTGNLCLDSAECILESIRPEELSSILSAFGEQVLKVDTSVKRVTLGTGGKTPMNLFAEVVKIPEKISQGLFYGDATEQYLISKTPSRLSKAQIETLQSRYSAEFCDVLFYLSDYLADTTNLPDEIAATIDRYLDLPHALDMQAMTRLLHYIREPSFDDLERIDFDTLQPQDADSSIVYLPTGRLMWQADTPEKIIKALPHIRPEDRLTAVKEKDRDGKTVLHSAASNPELLRMILSLLPESERLSALKEKDRDGLTVLHLAMSNPESLQMILSLYPESERLAAVKEKDRNGWTVLHNAVSKPQSLQVILSLYPESERLAAVKEKNQYGQTILHHAASNPESLQMILSLLPESDRLAAVKEKDGYGETVLHRVVSEPQSLQVILSLLPESDRLAAVKEEDENGKTVLHRVRSKPQSLQMILSLLPESDRLAAVKEKDEYGLTVLHRAASNLESLRMILSLLPESERLAALKEKDQVDTTVLYHAASNSESLQMILSLLPESDRLAAVKEKDENGETVLHHATSNPESLRMILSFLLESDRLAAVKEKDENGETVLHHATSNPESLRMILSFLLESDRLAAVKEKDENGETVLHHATSNPESLRMILSLLPESDRLAAVKEKDENGETVLHHATSNPESLRMILSLYPESDRLAAVKEKDENGETVLHRATSISESLRMILSLLPESDRLAAVKEKDENGETVLHRATSISESLRMILSLLPESDRLAAVKEKDNGATVLHHAAYNRESLRMILSFLLESDRLVAVKEKDENGATVLHHAAYNPESLRMILSLLPESDRLAAVKEKDENGETVLHRATSISESLRMILSLLPESDRLAAVKEKSQYGYTVLHHAASNPESLQMILSLLPESERLAAVKEKDRNDKAVLHHAAHKPQSLQMILSLLPLSDLLTLGREDSSIKFDVLKEVIITKVEELDYTPEQLSSIRGVSDINELQERLNIISQRKLKDSLPQEPDELSEKSEHKHR